MVEAAGQGVRIDRIGALIEISIANPPVNALSRAVRRGIAAALDAAMAPDVAAVVLCGAGAMFSAGADIAEFEAGGPGDAPDLAQIAARIEAFEKPVVAALSGAVLGGGLELALAAHLRVADATVQMALPEVRLGLLPGAGGTQRLPRLVGGAMALDLMLSGRGFGAAEGLALGVIDRVVTEDLAAVAREAALALVGRALPRTADRRDGLRDVTGYRLALETARGAQRGQRLQAPGRIVDCVEAALLLPFDRGLVFERAAFEDMLATPESAGLRHAFMAERAARRLPAGLPDAAPPQRLSVWGAAGDAADLVRAALSAGMTVVLADPSREAVVAALERIAAAHEAEVQAGRLTAAARDADWARLTPVIGPSRLGEGEVVVTTRADLALAAPRTVLCLGVPVIAGAVGLTLVPQAVPLAEMVLSADVPPARAGQAVAFARRLGWFLVPVGPGGPVAMHLATVLAETVAHLEGRGVKRALIAQALALAGIAGEGRAGVARQAEEVIARRCFGALANAGARLIAAGTARDAAQIDAIAIAAGIVARWTGGPMHQADRRGLMVLRRDLRVWSAESADLWAPAPLFDSLIAEGRGFAAGRVRTG
jgi:3-hydroxyacyl-CoA dehydrogenase